MDREITNYDTEGFCKVYRMLRSRCKLLDSSIFKAGVSFCAMESNGVNIIDYIMDIMELKNKLINFKTVFDHCVEKLETKYRQVILLKIYYSKLTVEEMCGILDVKERTLFRRIEQAFNMLADLLNKSKNKDKILQIYDDPFVQGVLEDVRERRKAFKMRNKEIDEQCK